MEIADAARATRKYWPAPHWEYPSAYFAATEGYDPENVGDIYPSHQQAQAACDHLNLLAVLESDALREPSERMANAAPARVDQSTEGTMYHGIWRTMIDALIAEVREQGNG